MKCTFDPTEKIDCTVMNGPSAVEPTVQVNCTVKNGPGAAKLTSPS